MKKKIKLLLGSGAILGTFISSSILGFSSALNSQIASTKQSELIQTYASDTEAYTKVLAPNELGSVNYNNSLSNCSYFRVGVNATVSGSTWTNGMMEKQGSKMVFSSSNSADDLKRAISDTSNVMTDLYDRLKNNTYATASGGWYNGISMRRMDIDGNLDYEQYLYSMYKYGSKAYWNYDQIYYRNSSGSSAKVRESHSGDQNQLLMDVMIENNKPMSIAINLGMYGTNGQYSRLRYTTSSTGWTDQSSYTSGAMNLYTYYDADQDLVSYSIFQQSYSRSDDGFKYYSGTSTISANDLSYTGSQPTNPETVLASTYLTNNATKIGSKINISTSNGYPGMISNSVKLVANDITGEIKVVWQPKTVMFNGVVKTYTGSAVEKTIMSGFNAKQPTSWILADKAQVNVNSLQGVDSIKTKKAPQITEADIQNIVIQNKTKFYKYLPLDIRKENIIVQLGQRYDSEGAIELTIRTNRQQKADLTNEDISNASNYIGGSIKLIGLVPYAPTKFKFTENQQVALSTVDVSGSDLNTRIVEEISNAHIKTLVFSNKSLFYSDLPEDLSMENIIVNITDKDKLAGSINVEIKINRIYADSGNIENIATPSKYVGGSIVLKGFKCVNTSLIKTSDGYDLGISSKTAKQVSNADLAKAIYAKNIIRDAKKLTADDISVEAIVPNNPDRSLTATIVISNSKAWENGTSLSVKRIPNIKFIGFADIIRTPSSIKSNAPSVISAMISNKFTYDIKNNITTTQNEIKKALSDQANIAKIANNVSINGYTTTVTNVSVAQKGNEDAFNVSITFNNWAQDPSKEPGGYVSIVQVITIRSARFSGHVSKENIIHNGEHSVDFDAIKNSIDPTLPKDEFINTYKRKVAEKVYASILNTTSIPQVIRTNIAAANTGDKVINMIMDGIQLRVVNTNADSISIPLTTIDLNGINKLISDNISFDVIHYNSIKIKHNVDWNIVWIALGSSFAVITIFISVLVTHRLRQNTRTRNNKLLHR